MSKSSPGLRKGFARGLRKIANKNCIDDDQLEEKYRRGKI